ncbi:MAG: ABC transporter permease [Hyphomicrobiales bacterium]|nr:ABC transporter permease [Hyphomicrobiales bacterium]
MHLIADIAATHIRGRGRQTFLSIAGVAMGVGFSIMMASLMQGSQEDFIDTLIDTIPHIAIEDEERHPPVQPASMTFDAVKIEGLRPREKLRGIRNADGIIASLESWLPGDVAPNLTGQAVIRYAGKDLSVTVVGIDVDAERLVSTIDDDMREGSLDDLNTTANGLVVGDGVLDRLGAKVGDLVTVTSPVGVVRKFKIVGSFHTGAVANDNGLGYTLLKTAQVIQDKANVVNRIRIRLDDVNASTPIAARLESQFGYKAESWEEANEGLMEAFLIRNIIMFTVVAAILIVAGFGIFNIISQITHEKAHDIAIMKSLGFPESDIIRIFVIEGLAIGAAGSLLGCVFGFALCQALGQVEFEFAATTEVTRLPLMYSVWHYAIASGFALGSAAVAGWLPARNAARLNPVDIIRGAA